MVVSNQCVNLDPVISRVQHFIKKLKMID